MALAWFAAGPRMVPEGQLQERRAAVQTVVFLHGGPGMDHRYLVPAAAPFTDAFRCVLYDQRGDGASVLGRVTAETVHVERHVEDLEALRAELGLERLTLVGHSWGASLALYYATRLPERVERLVLVGGGPMDAEMTAVYRANVARPLNAAEREEYDGLRQKSGEALAAGDAEAYRTWQRRRHELHARCWFYAPAAAEKYTAELLGLIEDPWTMAQRTILAGDTWKDGIWERVRQVDAPTLVMYGYQDYEPITQAYRLAALMPNAQPCLINECSHWVWLEQPAAFDAAVRAFLAQ